MDAQYNKWVPLIVIVFFLGVAVGYTIYAVQKPETEIKYINQTIELPPKIIEKIVEVTVTPTPTPTPVPTPTPEVSDFIVKIYDPSKDMPSKTIQLTNWRAQPDSLSVRLDEIVLIKITDYTLQSPITLFFNNTYSRNLGTSGAVIVNFNKSGTYTYKAIAPSSDPNILPRTYGEGTITVN